MNTKTLYWIAAGVAAFALWQLYQASNDKAKPRNRQTPNPDPDAPVYTPADVPHDNMSYGPWPEGGA